MIEVTLISATEGSRVGRFVSRKRANLEQLGVNKNQFIQGFLRDNMGELESILHNPDLVELINSDTLLNNKDVASIRYILSNAGYQMIIAFVADDELNPVSVPIGETEYNIIDNTWIQDDLPVLSKSSVAVGTSFTSVLDAIIKESGFFDPTKFTGVSNPLTSLLNQAKDDEKVAGTASSVIINRIYTILNNMGLNIYAIMGE